MTGGGDSISGPRRLRLGMVGGGPGSSIGHVHRAAARLDDRFELVAGVFSTDMVKNREAGQALYLGPARLYDNFSQMAKAEAARPDGIDAVAVVTPNHLHFEVAKAFLDHDIHVICDKPMTTSKADALKLVKQVAQTGLVFVLTHTYAGYAMVRQAREMVAAGALGAVRLVQVEYPQGWLATNIERQGHKQALWRANPKLAGPGGALGDIGTHAYHLLRYVSGLEVMELSADVQSFVGGRVLDDNAHVMLRLQGGARGMLWASQVATGEQNNLKIRLYGDKAGLTWAQEKPDILNFARLGAPPQLLERGGPDLHPAALAASRLPAGHPEGFIEALAQIYQDAATLIWAKKQGRPPLGGLPAVPGVADGLQGIEFILNVIESARNDGRWIRF